MATDTENNLSSLKLMIMIPNLMCPLPTARMKTSNLKTTITIYWGWRTVKWWPQKKKLKKHNKRLPSNITPIKWIQKPLMKRKKNLTIIISKYRKLKIVFLIPTREGNLMLPFLSMTVFQNTTSQWSRRTKKTSTILFWKYLNAMLYTPNKPPHRYSGESTQI